MNVNMNVSDPKTEALPKRGHVNEVCKEWLVREDGAFAYKLQSQEINDFYRGNRYRNEVVRKDFPTALNEQIKEKENAEKQTEFYKKLLSEQEEHDKHVAMQIAEKLERDLFEQRQRELEESEEVAGRLQSIYLNLPVSGDPENHQNQYSRNASTTNSIQASSQQAHTPKHSLPTTNTTPLHSRVESFHETTNNVHSNRYLFSDSFDSPHIATSATSNNITRNKHHTQQASIKKITQEPSVSAICDPNRSYVHNSAHKNNMNRHSPPLMDDPSQIRSNLNFQRSSQDHLEQSLDMSPHTSFQYMQEHADDIELYVDPSLQEIGLPLDEIKEMSKKIKQEKKDEELARRLQEMEQQSSLTLEDRDRLLAIEAQDKELAKMLQEREKAKAKRAKEKARLRKYQYQKESNGMHTGPLHPLPQDTAMSTSTISKSEESDPVDLEAYSNPKDLISHQRMQNDHIRDQNGQPPLDYTVDDGRDDDIYTLPVDSCGPNRPTSLNHTTDFLSRSEYLTSDLHHEPNDIQRMNHSMSSSFEQSSSPAPPYMPIQGTRRCNSNEERKKRSKDKCTHQ